MVCGYIPNVGIQQWPDQQGNNSIFTKKTKAHELS